MRGITLSRALVRSVSGLALAAGMAAPTIAAAQAAPVAGAADPQQGTPQANTAPGQQTEAGASATNAVPDEQANDIVVTGVRASLERSIAIKRDSFGVVDAISAEDIGKFPDTNLAESLQRITGVSINRVNGEGQQVTVRGFGPDFNLVTLNGRTLATSLVQVVGSDNPGAGNGRSFDFSNLSSEGVKTLEVYKTARSAIPSGGIGASINIVTRRPLDAHSTGLTGSIGVKADYETSVKDCISCGDKVTPEVTGLLSWANPNDTFGISLYGSYQKRNFSTTSATANGWAVRTLNEFLSDPSLVKPGATIVNKPANGNALVSYPDSDARYHFSENNRERLNGQAVVQFKPTDALTLTADALYARQSAKERRSDSSIWFSHPFDEVRFSNGDNVVTADYTHETNNGLNGNPGGPKDIAFENQYRAQRNTLQDYGLNARWDVTDRFTLSVDGHYSKAASTPDNPLGMSQTAVGLAANVVSEHSLDWSSGFPVAKWTFNDSVNGNKNGVFDSGDVGSTVSNNFTGSQRQKVKEIRADGGWDFGGGSRFDFGGNYRDAETNARTTTTRSILGDWSAAHPGDADSVVGGLQQFCLLCKFHHYDPQASGNQLVAFRTDATRLFTGLSKLYNATPSVLSDSNDTIREKIWAVYGQVSWKGEFAGLKAGLVAGLRYERTNVLASSLFALPSAVEWQSDNDFALQTSGSQAFSAKGHYDNLLPAMDFQVNFADNLIGRFSFGKTIARPTYDNLFAVSSVGTPNRPTYFGNSQPTASLGNPNLQPLISDNIDLSLEWYFKKDSYLSFGVFDKRVQNFIGNNTTSETLFGLRDPSSGAAGTRSGSAVAALQALGVPIDEASLFTMTALIANSPTPAQAQATYAANLSNIGPFQTAIANQYNITGNANDPYFSYQVTRPINNKSAQIYGFEVAGQYFLGDTGFGISGAYTHVEGDIGFDVAATPGVTQFALQGLSDTANGTLIYDKSGISARLSYNWRAKFLASANRGDVARNPTFVAPFGQLDVNISYDITPAFAITAEGINLTKETLKTYSRQTNSIWFEQEIGSRFLVGARYKF